MKKIYFIEKKFLCQQSLFCQSNLDFFVIVPVDVVFFRNSPIYMALLRMRNRTKIYVQNQSEPSNGILHHFCLTGGVHPHQSGLLPKFRGVCIKTRPGI